MYKLMIADSDPRTAENILSGIDIQELQIEQCIQAHNGVQAMELFMRYKPRIVITEAALPLRNGIEFVKQIQQIQNDTNVFIVTDVNSLAQAREAVRDVAGVMGKPVDLRALEKMLRQVINKEQLRMQQKRREALYTRAIQTMRSAFLLQLAQTPEMLMDTQEYTQSLSDFGLPEQPTQVCAAILVPNYADVPQMKIYETAKTLADELEKMMQPLGIGTIVLQDNMQRTLMICYGQQDNLAAVMTEKLSFLRDKVRYVYRQDFYAAVGKVVSAFAQLYHSHASAEHALCYWTSMGENHIINSEVLRGIELPPMQIPPVRYNDIMALLAGKDTQQITAALEQYLRQMAYETRNSVHNVQILAIELLATLINCAREIGGNVQQLFDEKPIVYVKIMQQSSIHEIMAQVQRVASILAQNIHARHDDSKYRALSDAKHYILQNYADPAISLAKVAAQVNLSPSYVSQLFKRNDNCTFTEYLNHVRIEQAKRLLSETHLRVYEVADAVGYKSAKYFFQLFKQITGKRPREFYQSSATDYEQS